MRKRKKRKWRSCERHYIKREALPQPEPKRQCTLRWLTVNLPAGAIWCGPGFSYTWEIWGSQGDVYEEGCLLGCCGVKLDDGGSKHLCSHPWRQPPSYSPPWGNETSTIILSAKSGVGNVSVVLGRFDYSYLCRRHQKKKKGHRQ
jgi:hypothetical protein